MNRDEMVTEVREQLHASADVTRRTAETSGPLLADVAQLLTETLESGHKILLCGNGGSASDSQHVATELLARYKREREALPAIALGADATYLTAMSNDYDFTEVFARQIAALGGTGDTLWAFSTSGNSANVLKAAQAARAQGMATVGFTGETGGKLLGTVDMCLQIPSRETARIQEAHIAAAHVICDLIERALAEQTAKE